MTSQFFYALVHNQKLKAVRTEPADQVKKLRHAIAICGLSRASRPDHNLAEHHGLQSHDRPLQLIEILNKALLYNVSPALCQIVYQFGWTSIM